MPGYRCPFRWIIGVRDFNGGEVLMKKAAGLAEILGKKKFVTFSLWEVS